VASYYDNFPESAIRHTQLCSSRRFDAAEGYRIGFVDRVVSHENLLDETKDYLRELAANVSPNSLAVIKSEVYRLCLLKTPSTPKTQEFRAAPPAR
jgi:enoyl-CoA hydratase/carnithine racemase